MSNKDLPIGIFDSGVGGLTVVAQVMKVLPHEEVFYLGDTARLPYGNKGKDTIIRFSLENGKYLVEQGIKLLVVACNTSSSVALQALQQALPIPVVGVISPGVATAVATTKNGHIAVLGTRGTIASNAYQQAIAAALPSATVYAVACPLFVSLVEEGFLDRQATRLIVQEYLSPLKGSKVDTVILGCTHYPLLRDHVQEELGQHVTIVDAAAACAHAVHDLLVQERLIASSRRQGCYRYFVSDNPEGFRRIGETILGTTIDHVCSDALMQPH